MRARTRTRNLVLCRTQWTFPSERKTIRASAQRRGKAWWAQRPRRVIVVLGKSVRLAAAGIAACGILSASAAGATEAVRPYKASCIDNSFSRFVLRVRPTKCIMASSPSAPYGRAANLAALRWKSWGGSTAVASGFELGFHLPYAHIPAVVTLTRPAFVEELNIYIYKHFRVRTRYGTLSGSIQAG